MSSFMKILLGGLASAFLAWLFYGPLGWGNVCAPTAEVTAPVAAVAAPANVVNCQSGVDAVITGKTINFDSGKATIKVDSNPLIDALATAAKGCSGAVVEVAGHTDQQGNDAANMTLSQNRANAVVAALVQRGVGKDQLVAKGYGETKLLDTAETPEALAKNRRIEFHVSSAAPAADAPAKTAG